MSESNRRDFLKATAGALGASLSVPEILRSAIPAAPTAPVVAGNAGKKPLRLGLIIGIGNNPDAALAKVSGLGIPTAQIYAEEFSEELVPKLRTALDKYKIEATSLVVGGPGREVWDFYEGPLTIGLVPRGTRAEQIRRALAFAKKCGIAAVQTHCGFLPKIPTIRFTRKPLPRFASSPLFARATGRISATKPARKHPSLWCERFRMLAWTTRASTSTWPT